MDTTELVETLDDALPTKHQFGKIVVGSTAAFIADKLAQAAYVKVLYAVRARRGR